MADKNGTPAAAEAAAGASTATSAVAPAAAPKANPAFRAMGLPNFRFRLPSRNWLIFFGVTGSWTAALIYDRREKKRIQKKWCDLVSHIAQEPLPSSSMPRRVTIFLAAPPSDGLRSVREHFTEYVKPVLVAAALDWDVVEGRREGTVRSGLAERIRKFRLKQGEISENTAINEMEAAIEAIRARGGIRPWGGVKGDIVIGRHTWKEYVRGLHEGWLGPIDDPTAASTKDTDVKGGAPEISSGPSTPPEIDLLGSPNSAPAASEISSDAVPTTNVVPPTESDLTEAPSEEEKKEEEPPPKPLVPPPFNSPTDYNKSTPPASIPNEFAPSTTIPFPHILGFLNTPIRMYRFLNRRKLADDVGRCTAAAVLEAYRPFSSPQVATDSSFTTEPSSNDITQEERGEGAASEQQRALAHEENEWPKAIRKRVRGVDGAGDGEMEWTDPMVLDPRIAERMRAFELDAAEEDRAERLYRGVAQPIRVRKPGDADEENLN